jgi:hypothetical protein
MILISAIDVIASKYYIIHKLSNAVSFPILLDYSHLRKHYFDSKVNG